MNALAAHPDYLAYLPAWQRARDVLAGEDAVKGAGTKYLPRLDGQSDEDYEAYKTRAAFFGATARTLTEYLDLIFRRAPVLTVEASTLGSFVENCDAWGTSFLQYARTVVTEVLSVGRAGSLVLHESERAVVSLWRAEAILDWGVVRAGGRAVLSRLVLADGLQRRVFRLVEGVCYQERWSQRGEGWFLVERAVLRRGGAPLAFVPFVFHGPSHSRPEPEKLPLAEIIAANLDHYRLDADLKHGAHFAALPTAWVTGFDKGTALRIGSSTAWVSEVPGASAGFLEFRGAGLEHLERAIDKAERRMALLGARMLEAPAQAGMGPQAPATLSGLGSLVASLNESLSRVLGLAHWWGSAGDVESASKGIGIAMNTDLAATAMSGADLSAVVGAWRSGAISRETMLDLLKRGEILPDGRTVAQERALIHRV